MIDDLEWLVQHGTPIAEANARIAETLAAQKVPRPVDELLLIGGGRGMPDEKVAELPEGIAAAVLSGREQERRHAAAVGEAHLRIAATTVRILNRIKAQYRTIVHNVRSRSARRPHGVRSRARAVFRGSRAGPGRPGRPDHEPPGVARRPSGEVAA